VAVDHPGDTVQEKTMEINRRKKFEKRVFFFVLHVSWGRVIGEQLSAP
jgi:hypothetical protein